MAYDLQKMKTSLEKNCLALKELSAKTEQKIEPSDVVAVDGFIYRINNLHKLLEAGRSSGEVWSPRESARVAEVMGNVIGVEASITDINKEADNIAKLFPEKYQGEAKLIISQIKNNHVETLAEIERQYQSAMADFTSPRIKH